MTEQSPVIGEIKPVRHHDWKNAEQREVAAHESPDGCDRIEKTCPICKIVRITVMPPHGFPFHLWRHPDDRKRTEFPAEATPPCVERVKG
jgi:hypothetical protein